MEATSVTESVAPQHRPIEAKSKSSRATATRTDLRLDPPLHQRCRPEPRTAAKCDGSDRRRRILEGRLVLTLLLSKGGRCPRSSCADRSCGDSSRNRALAEEL